MKTPQFVPTTTPTPAMPPVALSLPAQQGQEMPATAPPEAPAATQDSTQQFILQAMQTILGRLEALEGKSQETKPDPQQEVANMLRWEAEHKQPKLDWEREKQLMVEEARFRLQKECEIQEEMDMRDKECPERRMDTHLLGLEFLQPAPQKPTIKVVFDLGRGGQHLKRFHHCEITKDLVVLIYDDRYEGDRFHPPSTEPGDRIRVTFPDDDDRSFDVIVPPMPKLNFTIGCMDVLQLVICPPNAHPRSDSELTDEELVQRSQEIPTRWREPDLEQAIRTGFFDAGAAS